MSVYILGAGGFAREVEWLINNSFNEGSAVVEGFICDDKKVHGTVIGSTPVIGSIESIELNENDWVICGVGSPVVKRKFVERAKARGFRILNWQAHRSVAMSSRVEIGDGTLICANSSVTTNIRIGKHVAINLNCTIGHDVVIEDYCNISPGVSVSGYCHLESDVDIGTGAVILPHVRIGRGAVIGAGSVANKDVPAGETWAGVPARPLIRKETVGV